MRARKPLPALRACAEVARHAHDALRRLRVLVRAHVARQRDVRRSGEIDLVPLRAMAAVEQGVEPHRRALGKLWWDLDWDRTTLEKGPLTHRAGRGSLVP